jgi:hypothetical protein
MVIIQQKNKTKRYMQIGINLKCAKNSLYSVWIFSFPWSLCSVIVVIVFNSALKTAVLNRR